MIDLAATTRKIEWIIHIRGLKNKGEIMSLIIEPIYR
jgi:hypothetical protein